MDLEHMHEFVVLAETRNFSSAASRLYLSQPTLSRHIVAIEEAIGAQLVRRSTRAVELTPAGTEALAAFTAILAEYEGLAHVVAGLSHGLVGSIHVGMLYYTIAEDVTPFVDQFKADCPNVRVSLTSYQPTQLLQDLLAGRIDIGPHAVSPGATSDALRFVLLGLERFSAMVADGHRLAGRASVRLEDLRDEELIHLEQDAASSDVTRAALTRCGFTPRRVEYAEHIDTVAFAVRETGGVHVTAARLAKVAFPGVVMIPIDDEDLAFQMALAYRLDNPNPVLPMFLKSIETVIGRAAGAAYRRVAGPERG